MAKKQQKIEIDGQWYRVSEKTGLPSKVPLTRCGNTMTESEWKGWILGGLRDKTMMWPPAQKAWKLNTRPNQSGSRHKLEHNCNICKGWFVLKKINTDGKRGRNSVELDHIIPTGGLSDLSRFEDWCNKAYVEVHQYQKLCYQCHSIKTKSERANKCKMT